MTRPKCCCMAYVTVPTKAVAATVARSAVESKLAACSNVLGPVTSTYRWNGKIEHSKEFVLLLKTTEANYGDLQKLILEHHPYENPCVIRIDIADGSPAYLNWIAQSVL